MKITLLTFLLFPLLTNAQIITTVVGNGIGGFNGDGGPATAAKINNPHGGIFDRNGNFYFVQTAGARVSRVDTVGIITTIAGTGVIGSNGDGGPATNARIYPDAITVDTIGNLYITDSYKVRMIDTFGTITTIAGNGTPGYSGDNGPASAALLHSPWGICFDKYGNLFVGDGFAIRKINTSGTITTIAGNDTLGFAGDGGPATSAKCGTVLGICIDSNDNLYFADGDNRRIRKIDSHGIITTYAGDGVSIYNGDVIAATNAQFGPVDIKIDKDANLYIVDISNQRIRKVDASGIIHTIAGTGVGGYNGDYILADTAKIYNPAGMAIDNCGNIYFGDAGNNRVRKVTFDSTCNSGDSSALTINKINKPLVAVIYPNPATTSLTITSSQTITNVTITSLIGQTIYTHEYNSSQVQIDVANLPTGIYFVKINGGVVRKFVKE